MFIYHNSNNETSELAKKGKKKKMYKTHNMQLSEP